jgi:hypothetical protein
MKCRLCLIAKTSDGSWKPTCYLSKNTFEFTVRSERSEINHWFNDQDSAYQFLLEKQLDGKAAILFDDGRMIRCDREGYVPTHLNFPVEIGDFYLERHCPESGHNKEYSSFGPYQVLRWDTSDWGSYNPLREPGYGNQRLAFPTFEDALEAAEMLPKCEYGWSVWVCGPNVRKHVYGETCFEHLHWTEVPYKTSKEKERILSQLEKKPYYLKNMPRHVEYWQKLDSRVIAWFNANKHREYADLKEEPNWNIDNFTGLEINTEAWLNNWIREATPLYKFVTEGKLDSANSLRKLGDSINFKDGEFSSWVRLVRDTTYGETIETLEDAYEVLGYFLDDLEDDEMEEDERKALKLRAKRILDGTLIPAELEYSAYSKGVEMENDYAETCMWDTEDLSNSENREAVLDAWSILYRCTKQSFWMIKTDKDT